MPFTYYRLDQMEAGTQVGGWWVWVLLLSDVLVVGLQSLQEHAASYATPGHCSSSAGAASHK